MNKLNGQSMDLIHMNIEKLKSFFPEVFIEGKIDFDKLKLLLGSEIEVNEERYEFRWNGKSNSIKIAQTPSRGTLRPDKESSKNWDDTNNLYIEGDNLEVLKLLHKSYFGKIKMIYIDPPYNTGKDFVYKDDFSDNIINYKEITKQSTKANTETNGRHHTEWLNMMYPRLKLAKNLLKEDGVIFISIDENEMVNLKKICDEIFSEDNLISTLIWANNERGRSIDKFISNTNEYILMYAKNINLVSINQRKESGKELLKEYCLKDSKSYYKKGDPLFNNNSKFNIETRPNLVYSIYINKNTNEKRCIDEKYTKKDGTITIDEENKLGDEWIKVIPPLRKTNNKIGCWRWSITKFIEENDTELMLLEEKNGKYMFYSKNRLDANNEKEYKYKNIINGITSSSGTSELVNLLENKIFDHPKPVKLIKLLLEQATDKDSIVLDFFSGSSTTAHSVIQLNQEDNGKRSFIMVQLPELIDETNEAYKSGYNNICEIGKERIRRAGEKIIAESGKSDLDIGFKVFKLDSSNIKEWDLDYNELESKLYDRLDNLKIGRSKEDLLYEILIKMGIELATSIEKITLEDKIIFNIGSGSLLICLEDEITEEIIKEMLKYKSESIEMKIVFKETGFKTDSAKMNAMLSLKRFGINDVRSI
ncbi:site-specific DNA-methyltransferase [Clostridioides sp. ZZV13-5731]|uniref:site-specific DNA-methyltransferase n=1 Tax=unclassified Clostridioides TaxID=2635829 RepID=UPI001C1CB5D3|nr:site-specific DNA-methyltransferase [Clostridioides sp. ZZV15-6388]MCC0728823.1 site-specific DNA-methyltransferase [Clostridioides sp. ZZV14-6045]MCC0752672.1 site-specific DNA-methyltransferase [Clostridioides sp. ZZV13-5731]MDB2749259.1 site-specific DNA-methyltransferase [Clostridioides difficile]HBG3326866.1 site-specific DNA-methyltransferase [Clostridioides difficile]